MNPLWTEILGDLAGRECTGTGTFRMMPHEEFATGPATGSVEAVAGGYGLMVRYAWTHHTDGPQQGALLVSAPEGDDLGVQATLLDSWHQKPGPMHLAGTYGAGKVEVAGTYMETWGWQIDVDVSGESGASESSAGESGAAIRMVMRNVVPEEALALAPEGMEFEAGPYVVSEFLLS